MPVSRPRPRRRPEGEAAAAEPDIRRAALDLLSRREHSSLELRRKLAVKGFDVEAVERVLAGLTRDGLQSDARFTEAYVYARAGRGYGPLRIRAELGERGIAEALADAALMRESGEWQALAESERRKRFGVRTPSVYEERARQHRFLAHRGFTGDQIRRALQEDGAEEM